MPADLEDLRQRAARCGQKIHARRDGTYDLLTGRNRNMSRVPLARIEQWLDMLAEGFAVTTQCGQPLFDWQPVDGARR